MLADQLILALGLVHGNLPARDDARAVGRFELQGAQRRAEHESTQLRGFVFARAVQMSRVTDAAVGELALDPDLEQLRLDEIADLDGELRDAQDTANRGSRTREWCLPLPVLRLKTQIAHNPHL